MRTFSLDSELRVIAALCDGSDEIRATLQSALVPEHFAGEETLELYNRILGFLNQNRPIPNLKTMRLEPTISENARDMLAAKLDVVESVDKAGALLDQIELYRKLRVIHTGTQSVLGNLREPSLESITRSINALERVVMDARAQYEGVSLVTAGKDETAGSVIRSILSKDRPDRVLTGFRAFDAATGGFARRDLVLIAATSNGGKSVMANQLAINAYLLQCRDVAIVSFEMDDEEIYARILSALTAIPFELIYLHKLTEEQTRRCEHAWEVFTTHGKRNACKFAVWCPGFDVTPEQIGAILKPNGFDEILIDYVGLVNPEQKAALWENLGDITKGFKSVARTQNNVVIVMAQLDEDTNKVKYSKAMKHHSSYVWQWVYGEEQRETNEILLEMSKARHCKCFNMDLIANYAIMSIDDKYDTPTSAQTIAQLAKTYGMRAPVPPPSLPPQARAQPAPEIRSTEPAEVPQERATFRGGTLKSADVVRALLPPETDLEGDL
jgi:replicative DNA helicase